MTEKTEYHITIEENGVTAVAKLAEATSLSRQKIKQCMQKGAVWLTQGKTTRRLRRAKKSLSVGSELHLYYNPNVLEKKPKAATLISDEGLYSVWNKPYGMLSQGSKWGDHCTVYRWAETHLTPERPAFIVHRLDRAATGLILLAHTKKMATQLTQLFQNRQIEKHYRVYVEGEFLQKQTIQQAIEGKPAISHIKPINFIQEKNQSLLDVHIETGRKHQIRKHLSSIGYPVIGDRLYGSQQLEQNLQLMSHSLEFKCPIKGEKICFTLEES